VANQHQTSQKVLFIGDGSSDFCASGIADFVLAKDRLQEYCQQQGISYAAIHDFHEASNLLENILEVAIALPTTPAISTINSHSKRMLA
jgi:2-hydroxy-3-keto-5-methylthiopentenyl-1-phosphate phosphatase